MADLKFERVNVTPAKAKAWLSKNHANRTLSKPTFQRYARTMAAKRWGESPHPIVFNGDGSLIDGQHRLAAVVLSGVTIPMWVCRGATADMRQFIDHGRKRSTSDVLHMEHGIQYATTIAASARWVNLLSTGLTEPLAPHEVLHFFEHPKFRKGFDWLQQCPRHVGFTGAFFLGPLVWLSQGYYRDVVEFQRQVDTGAMLKADSPALKLRDAITTRESDTQYAIALKTLNAFADFIDGTPCEKLYARKEPYERFRKKFGYPETASAWLKKASLTVRRKRNYIPRG